MPCFFFNNLPKKVFDHTWFQFDSQQVKKLRQRIAKAVDCPPKKVEFHFVRSGYLLLEDDGNLVETSVHIEVEWHAGRDAFIKQEISDALFAFMKFHHMEKSLDITFRDSPSESFFTEMNGKMVLVPGGSLPPGIVIPNFVKH